MTCMRACIHGERAADNAREAPCRSSVHETETPWRWINSLREVQRSASSGRMLAWQGSGGGKQASSRQPPSHAMPWLLTTWPSGLTAPTDRLLAVSLLGEALQRIDTVWHDIRSTEGHAMLSVVCWYFHEYTLISFDWLFRFAVLTPLQHIIRLKCAPCCNDIVLRVLLLVSISNIRFTYLLNQYFRKTLFKCCKNCVKC
jgi:hypothetical protein